MRGKCSHLARRRRRNFGVRNGRNGRFKCFRFVVHRSFPDTCRAYINPTEESTPAARVSGVAQLPLFLRPDRARKRRVSCTREGRGRCAWSRACRQSASCGGELPGTRGDVVLSLNHFLAGTMQSGASVGRQVEDIYTFIDDTARMWTHTCARVSVLIQ